MVGCACREDVPAACATGSSADAWRASGRVAPAQPSRAPGAGAQALPNTEAESVYLPGVSQTPGLFRIRSCVGICRDAAHAEVNSQHWVEAETLQVLRNCSWGRTRVPGSSVLVPAQGVGTLPRWRLLVSCLVYF